MWKNITQIFNFRTRLAEIQLCYLVILLHPLCVVGCGYELIVTLTFLASAEVMGGREGPAEEMRRIRWQRKKALSEGFSSSAHIQGGQSHMEGSLTYGKMSQVLQHLSLVSSSLLLHPPTSISGFTYVIFMGSVCCNPGI